MTRAGSWSKNQGGQYSKKDAGKKGPVQRYFEGGECSSGASFDLACVRADACEIQVCSWAKFPALKISPALCKYTLGSDTEPLEGGFPWDCCQSFTLPRTRDRRRRKIRRQRHRERPQPQRQANHKGKGRTCLLIRTIEIPYEIIQTNYIIFKLTSTVLIVIVVSIYSNIKQ